MTTIIQHLTLPLLLRGVVPWLHRMPPQWVLFGAFLPDLVDKPLAILMGDPLLGRSFAHFPLGPALVVGVAVAYRSRVAAALGFGWASHLLLDSPLAQHYLLAVNPVSSREFDLMLVFLVLLLSTWEVHKSKKSGVHV